MCLEELDLQDHTAKKKEFRKANFPVQLPPLRIKYSITYLHAFLPCALTFQELCKIDNVFFQLDEMLCFLH